MQEKCQEAFDELEALAREIPMLRNAKVLPKPKDTLPHRSVRSGDR